MPRYNVIYEVTCNGFNAEKKDRIDYILWVNAGSRDVIALALEQADLTVKCIQTMRGSFTECDFDMRLEEGYADFINRVRELGYQEA